MTGMSLLGKNALVTGGSRGIGHAIALGLAKEGSNITIGYSTHDREAEETVSGIKKFGVKGSSFRLDQENMEEVSGLGKFAIETMGKVDILINNAGICPFKNFFDIDRTLFERVWKINVESHFFLTQMISKHMVDKKIKGKILFISSISAIVGGEFQAHYTTTKSALNGMMHSLAIVLGKYNVMVNSLEPGTIITDINRNDLKTPGKREYMESRIPLKRLGEPEDMVGPALFLVSDQNTYVTGAELLADGGMLVNLQ